jgi:hypothetical protein
MSNEANRTETANIHLEVYGREHVFPLEFQLGEQTIAGILPFAQQLTNELTSLSIAQVESEGKKISCQMGCGACCRQLVAISLVEAQDLARVVREMPPERQAIIRERFAEGIAKLESAGLLDAKEQKGDRDLIDTEPGSTQSSIPRIAKKYFEQGVACPFLETKAAAFTPIGLSSAASITSRHPPNAARRSIKSASTQFRCPATSANTWPAPPTR